MVTSDAVTAGLRGTRWSHIVEMDTLASELAEYLVANGVVYKETLVHALGGRIFLWQLLLFRTVVGERLRFLGAIFGYFRDTLAWCLVSRRSGTKISTCFCYLF